LLELNRKSKIVNRKSRIVWFNPTAAAGRSFDCVEHRLAAQAILEIGMRRFASASADLRELTQMTVYREDPYLQTQRALTDARLSIAQKDLALARTKLEEPAGGTPGRATHGESIR